MPDPSYPDDMSTREGAPRAIRTVSALGSNRVSSRTADATRRARARTAAGGARNLGSHEGMPAPLAVGLVLTVLLAVAVVFLPRLGKKEQARTDVEAGIEVEIVVPEGSGAASIAEILYDAGVIESREAFSSALRKQEAEQSLKSGAYSFLTLSDAGDVVRQLVEGPNATSHVVTVPEGLTVAKTAAVVEEALGIPAPDFVAQAAASNYVADYPFLEMAADDSLEGFLFPKTYDFSGTDFNADTVIRRMLDQYQLEVASLDFAGAEETLLSRFGIDFSDYDLLRIASIVERETNTDEDRPTVASVISNRLRDGSWMPLQCDSTIEYLVGHVPTSEDLKIDSPYNTYTNYGLPPTPICNPSLASIKAALDPTVSEYLYFYIEGDYHAFSETYDQHMEAIALAP